MWEVVGVGAAAWGAGGANPAEDRAVDGVGFAVVFTAAQVE